MIFIQLLATLLVAKGSSGYYFPLNSPPPLIRGYSQGQNYWSDDKSDDFNRFTYQSPPYHQYLDNPYYQPERDVYPSPYQFEVQQLPQTQQFSPYQVLNQQNVPTTIPILIKLPDDKTIVVPVKAVYALPSFLERFVQRIQGYYSVYNPVESLTLDRPYYAQTSTPPPQQSQPIINRIQTEKPENSTAIDDNDSETTTETTITTESESETETETATEIETTEPQEETTTDAVTKPSEPESVATQEGYNYKKPERSLEYPKSWRLG